MIENNTVNNVIPSNLPSIFFVLFIFLVLFLFVITIVSVKFFSESEDKVDKA